MTEKTRKCPECGIVNPMSRVTCEVCHKRFYAPKGNTKGDAPKVETKLQKELWKLNAELEKAREEGKSEKVQAVIAKRIETKVARTEGVFTVGENGLAKQVKATAPPRAKAEPKTLRHCPCCDGETKSFFIQGHDGRVHGMFKKVQSGKMKTSDLNDRLRKMYQIWNKQHLPLRECAAKTA